MTTGGTTTGGTTGGGVTVGGTTAGGGNTGGTTTCTGTSTVIVTGLDFTGGFGNVLGPVGFDLGGEPGVDGAEVGPAVTDGTEPATVGVGFTEGVGTPAAACLRCCGTTMSELPLDCVGDPKFEPATG